MRSTLLFIITGLVLFAILSCNKSNDHCIPESFAYEVKQNTRIDTLTGAYNQLTFQLNPGNHLVFQYVHSGKDCPEIADEEYAEYLLLEYDLAAEHFEVSDQDLVNLKCLYRSVSMVLTPAQFVTEGYVHGTRLFGNTWELDVHIRVPGRTTFITFKKEFKP